MINDSLKQVVEFHELFDSPIGELNNIETLETRQLRIKLLFEELEELALASDVAGTFYDLCDNYIIETPEDCLQDGDNVDKEEELDALCDIQYVLNGKIITSGLQDCFDENFNLVHINNMTKAHESEEHCQKTIDEKTETGQEGFTYYEKNGKYLLFNKHNKLTKPYDHQKVKLKLY